MRAHVTPRELSVLKRQVKQAIAAPTLPEAPAADIAAVAVERDCIDLFGALAQAWRAMCSAQRQLTSPEPDPIEQVVAEQALERAIVTARQVLDRTSSPGASVPVRPGHGWTS